MKRNVLTALALASLAAGCATTDDPRQGGLFGYWGTGSKGYEQRLERRKGEVGTVQQQAEEEKARAAGLEKNREGLREKLKAQQAQMETLDRDLEALQRQCEDLQAANDRQAAERQKVLAEMQKLQGLLSALQGDATSELADKQQKIDALNTELKQLRERASLLTTL